MSKNKNKQFFEGKDSFSRMNFLYQASMLMAERNPVLSAYYGSLCKNIGKKSVLRIDPQLKRNLCKKCSLALRPGITSDLSIPMEIVVPVNPPNSSRDGKVIDDNLQLEVKCRKCRNKRNFKINSKYNFWLEKPESVDKVTILTEKGPTKEIAIKQAKDLTTANGQKPETRILVKSEEVSNVQL